MERFISGDRRSDKRNAVVSSQRLCASLALTVLIGTGGIGSAASAFAAPSGSALEDFFRGRLEGTGTEQDSEHASARGVSFAGKGVPIQGGIKLTYDVVFSDGERQHKVWTFLKVGTNHYVGQRDDLIGTANITKVGNDIHMNYIAKVPTKNGTRNLTFQEDFSRTAQGALINSFKATYLFFTVASGEVTFQKVGG